MKELEEENRVQAGQIKQLSESLQASQDKLDALQQVNDPKKLFDQYLQKVQQLNSQLQDQEALAMQQKQDYDRRINELSLELDRAQNAESAAGRKEPANSGRKQAQIENLAAQLKKLEGENAQLRQETAQLKQETAQLRQESDRMKQLSEVQQKLQGSPQPKTAAQANSREEKDLREKLHYSQNINRTGDSELQSSMSYRPTENHIDDKVQTDQACKPCLIF